MKRQKLEEGQIEDGVGWYMKRGKKLWRFVIYIHQPGTSKLLKRKGSGFESRADAERAANVLRFRAEHAQAGLTLITARPTLAELIEKRLPTLSRQEQKFARKVLDTWLSLLPAGIQVQSIETEHVRLYVERRKADGLMDSSINRELCTIAATLNQAGEFFGALKQWRRPKLPRPKGGRGRREATISDEDYRKMMAALMRPPDERDGNTQNRSRAQKARVRIGHIVEFAMLSAARRGEILSLEWSSVDWANGRILIYQSKTKRYKQIPITAPMRALLEHYQRNPVSAKYVFTVSGKRLARFEAILRKACDVAGVPYGRHLPNGFTLHVSRHTVTTRLIQAGHDLDTVGLITGHSARELIAHYAHHDKASLARAAEALEKIGDKKIP